EHDGLVLYETQAILRYIDRALPRPPLTPGEPKAAARMDQALNVCDWYLFQGVNHVIGFQRIVGPQLLGLTPDEAAIAAAMPKAHMVFAELERLLGDKAFLAAEDLTLADLHVAPHLDFLAMTPEWQTLTAQTPNLVRWLDRMNARASFKATTWERVAAMAKAAWWRDRPQPAVLTVRGLPPSPSIIANEPPHAASRTSHRRCRNRDSMRPGLP